MSSLSSLLLVEPNREHEDRALSIISGAGIPCTVKVARDGAEACAVLFNSAKPPPSLVLLDLGLPKSDGLQILERMRNTAATRRVPIVVFTGPGEVDDVARSYELGVNSFVRKSPDRETYESAMRLVLFYWMGVNERCG